ncbi:ABC transporter permease [Candidatus Bipolaricaulota bacterium]|nr:ABC transporter permease [Candidatus Bipolaricaulota bacterium]
MGENRKIWRTFRKNKIAVAGLVLTLIIGLIALLAPMISPYSPVKQDVLNQYDTPGGKHFFGTDNYGRDILSRIIWASRISLLVGFFSVLFGMVVGSIAGVVAGYVGGWGEGVLMRIVDIGLSFPTLVLGLVIMAVLGSGLDKLVIAIGVAMAPRFARIAHGPTLSIREESYIEAAKAIGASPVRILGRHVVPNILGEIIVMATLWVATAIRIEANLSFIGLGVSPPTPSWGNMVRAGVNHLIMAPWLSLLPGAAILITVLSFNMIGDGVRDITDPKLQS